MDITTALDQLKDAIRAEVREEVKTELVAVLDAWKATLHVAEGDEDDDPNAMDPCYMDGVDDAILTLVQS